MQEEKEKLKKDTGIRQYRDEILGLGQDKDQMLRLQHYRDRMLGLTENRSVPRHEKLNMWSIKEGNENILRLDEYMNELAKLQETREEMLKMQREGLMRLQQDREEMLKMQQDGLLKLQRDREEIMHLQEELLAALQQGTSSEEKLQKTMQEMLKLQEDTDKIFQEQQNHMLTFQKDRDDMERNQQEGLLNMRQNEFFQLVKKKNKENLCTSLNLQRKERTEDNNQLHSFSTTESDSINENEIKSNDKPNVLEIKKIEQEKKPTFDQPEEQKQGNLEFRREKPSLVKSHTMSIDKRNFGMDVVRSIAVILVLSIHFFLYNGYYALPQIGIKVWLVDWARSFFFVGVPLFLMITGFLRGTKKPTLSYYLGIIPILLTWAIVTAICILFKIYYLDIHQSTILWIADIFNYTGATYSWYIEMYIGIFLLCPFLNRITEHMDKKQFRILLGTMIALTFLPTLTNRWGGKELNLNILPDYWMSLYPFTYYFIGSYIRKFSVKLSLKRGILAALLFAMIKGSILYYTANEGIFVERIGDGYSDIFVAGTSICLFLAFYDLKTENRDLKRVFYHISKVSLAIYLVSWIFDRILYAMMFPYFSIDTYIWCYFIFVPTSFFCSLLTATVIERVVQWIYRNSLNMEVFLKNKRKTSDKIAYKRG